jgi:hypothetical protein
MRSPQKPARRNSRSAAAAIQYRRAGFFGEAAIFRFRAWVLTAPASDLDEAMK